MVEMFLYALGMMCTPGPLNILALNAGLKKKFRDSFGFIMGVGVGLLLLLLFYGYSGGLIIQKKHLFYICLVGSGYIIFLALKIFYAEVKLTEENSNERLTFKDGLFIQILNPKATLATLPIATINYPANNITGLKILLMSLLLAFLGFCATTLYSFFGQYFGNLIKHKNILNFFNKLMAILLIFVALNMLKEHVFIVLIR